MLLGKESLQVSRPFHNLWFNVIKAVSTRDVLVLEGKKDFWKRARDMEYRIWTWDMDMEGH